MLKTQNPIPIIKAATLGVLGLNLNPYPIILEPLRETDTLCPLPENPKAMMPWTLNRRAKRILIPF